MFSVDVIHAAAALLWPLVVAAALVVLLPVIRRLMKSSQSVEIEVAGTKISIQNASDDIRKLIEDLQDRVNALEGPQPAGAGDYEAPPAPPRPRKILWVDDRPNANVYERARVMDAGYGLVQADTTDAALRKVASDGPFEAIVSDMRRVEAGGVLNPTAGLDLVRSLRRAADPTRVVFYSSRASLDPVMDDLRQVPSIAYTTSSTELMQLLGISGHVVPKVPDRS